MTQFFVVGLSHQTASLDVREKFYISDSEAPRLLQALSFHGLLEEGVVLSTCNRTELYGTTSVTQDLFLPLVQFLSKWVGVFFEDNVGFWYCHRQEKAAHHLFRVASGLDSMVLGETEIQRQVKRAFERSKDLGFTGPVLNRLCEKALNAAKAVRERTGISKGKVSVVSCVVEIAQKIFGEGLPNKTIAVVGTGEMGLMVAKRFSERGVCSMFVLSRSAERATALASRLKGEALTLEQLASCLTQCDMVVTSTHCPHFLLTKPLVQNAMLARKERPLFLIDISVPRNIDPEIHGLEEVYLCHLDDLMKLIADRLRAKTVDLALCDQILSEKVAYFMNWFEERKELKEEMYGAVL